MIPVHACVRARLFQDETKFAQRRYLRGEIEVRERRVVSIVTLNLVTEHHRSNNMPWNTKGPLKEARDPQMEKGRGEPMKGTCDSRKRTLLH